MTMEKKKPYDLVVFGASGFTGRLVVEYLLQQQHQESQLYKGTSGDNDNDNNGDDDDDDARRPLAWAVAGRSHAKVTEVMSKIIIATENDEDSNVKKTTITADALPVIVCDSQDRDSLVAMCRQTNVIVTTVGPYAKYGRLLVEVCAAEGIDYCDLTGESYFIRDMIDQHHQRAQVTGARIVTSAGFDSIPSDLGTLMLVDHLRRCHTTGTRICKFGLSHDEGRGGGVSGGTLDSVWTMLENGSRTEVMQRVRRSQQPYFLNPREGKCDEIDDGGDGSGRGGDGRDQTGVWYDRQFRTFTAPFVMASINERIVRRSNALYGYCYGGDRDAAAADADAADTGAAVAGSSSSSSSSRSSSSSSSSKGFRYSEAMLFQGWMGAIKAAIVVIVVQLFMILAFFPWTRAVLKRLLPKPGEGPSAEQRHSAQFRIRMWAQGQDGTTEVRGLVGGNQDPGYGETAKMLSETGIALALSARRKRRDSGKGKGKSSKSKGNADDAELALYGNKGAIAARLQQPLPLREAGGLMTPATACGMPLLQRLRRAGMIFEVMCDCGRK